MESRPSRRQRHAGFHISKEWRNSTADRSEAEMEGLDNSTLAPK